MKPKTKAKAKAIVATIPVDDAIDEIRYHHRRRRFAMKIQQTLDRRLESFVRVNATGWKWDLPQEERSRINKEVRALIKRIRGGEESPHSDMVYLSDKARGPADEMREKSEKNMATIAKQLPAYQWVKTIHGAGELGLATIVAEAGNLSRYTNPAKLWKRLGFAPYEGFAGSSWKRDSWRPRALSKEEWIENPFSGERYALMHQVAVWLVNAQWIGKAKTESGEGEPDGPYGEIYSNRRKHTAKIHPDWSDGHRRMDALRVAMKAFLKDLHLEWRALDEGLPASEKNDERRREAAE
jgi:hypothetical protein